MWSGSERPTPERSGVVEHVGMKIAAEQHTRPEANDVRPGPLAVKPDELGERPETIRPTGRVRLSKN